MKMMTSAAANKYLRALDEEKQFYLTLEENASTYVLADNERQEAPEYDYNAVSAKLAELNAKICTVKHAINLFNVRTKLEKFDMTIDQALVYLAQLSRNKNRLDVMRRRQPKTRVNDRFSRSNLIEYMYVNYDLDQAREDFEKVSDEISRLQMALDYCNQTIEFEVDVD